MLFNDTTLQRFWIKVNKNGPVWNGSPCWSWTAAKDPLGYGRFRTPDYLWLSHRFSYTNLVGPIPNGMTLDHLCRNPNCVNPEHSKH